MGAEIELAEEEPSSVFSARRIRARLSADPANPVACFRAALVWGRDRLYGLFNDGAPADSLVHARAYLVDEVLAAAWHRFLPQAPAQLALIAVGGYGRGELLPHSDIDLLLLHEGDALSKHQGALEQFFAFLWDIGLEVGSSVRTVSECAEYAAADITVITNLLEARALVGDPQLFGALQAAITADKIWPVGAFFQAKVDEQIKRHRKYDDTGYKLEPNVKEGPGGLRDIHTVAWVAKRQFGAQTLTELRDRGFLSKQECDELFGGQDFLWRVRFALHMITGRHEDRLLFDHQVRVAALFGYVDQDHNKAVEQFMQLYYRTIKALSCLNDMLLQLFEEAILRRRQDEAPRILNTRFQVRGGYLEALNDQVFINSPYALIEIFTLLQRDAGIDGISAHTLRLIRRDRRLINDDLRADVRARRLFIGMFRHGAGLTHALRRMNRYGVLERYLPVFGAVVGRMQYDLFHTLTVDEHSLYVIRNLRRMAMTQFEQELPFFSELMKRIPRPELLYLAGMFHDLAKGRGGDHSELGAEDAERFGLEHGMSHSDIALVSWLVRNHLMMSLTAQRQDISNPEIVLEFARRVGDSSRLDHLLLLTVADIRATNPALWNSWRESLLKELYRTSRQALERGLDNPVPSEERVAEQQRAALALLPSNTCDQEQVQRTWARFDSDYFLRHSPDELAWHLPAICRAGPRDLPLVLVKVVDGHGTSVFVYTRDRDHLFGLTAGVLARLGLNILDARINTTADGYTLDSYIVMESDGKAVESEDRRGEIRAGLCRVLADESISVVDVNRHLPTQLRHFNTPTSVYISQDATRNRTVLELVAADRPGLLAMVGRVFQKRGILIDAAKIATIGERAEDVFFITDRQHQLLQDPVMLESLQQVLTRALDHGESNMGTG